MERSHIIAIAGATVFVLYVGIQLFAGSGELDEGMPMARRSGAERGSDASDGGDYSGRGDSGEGRYASGSRGGEGSRSRDGGSGVASRGEGGSRRESSTGASRLSQTLASRAERRAGGSVGSGTRAGGGTSGGSGVFDRTGSRQFEGGGAPHRSDVVEHLASQPASAAGRATDDDEDGDGEGGDVALQLKRPEDAEGAGLKKDVEAPDQSDEGLTFTEGSQLAFPDGGNLNGEAGTISFEIEPNWNGNDETNNSLVTLRSEHGWSNRIELVKNGRYLRFILADNVGREADISVPIDAWVPGEAHDVKATWANGRTELHIDGVKVGENTYTEFIRPDAPLYIGSDHRGSSYSGLNGTVRNFKAENTSPLGSSS